MQREPYNTIATLACLRSSTEEPAGASSSSSHSGRRRRLRAAQRMYKMQPANGAALLVSSQADAQAKGHLSQWCATVVDHSRVPRTIGRGVEWDWDMVYFAPTGAQLRAALEQPRHNCIYLPPEHAMLVEREVLRRHQRLQPLLLLIAQRFIS